MGHARDAEVARTRIVPLSEAGHIPPGTLVYATIRDRETVKGRFRGMDDSAGEKHLRIEAEGTEQRIPMADVNEVAAEAPSHKYLGRGLMIGAAVDITLLGGGFFLLWEIQKHTTRVE
jgi:hypothetical protein